MNVQVILVDVLAVLGALSGVASALSVVLPAGKAKSVAAAVGVDIGKLVDVLKGVVAP